MTEDLLYSVHAKGVYGRRDLSFILPKDSRLAFIHGENGTGKSTLLRLVHRVLRGHVVELQAVKFDRIELTFSAGRTISVIQSDDTMTWVVDGRIWTFPIISDSGTDSVAYLLDRYLSGSVEQVGPSTWVEPSTNRIVSLTDMVRELPRSHPLRDAFESQGPLVTFPVDFIGTDRLRALPIAPVRLHNRARYLPPGALTAVGDPLERERRELQSVARNALGSYAEKSQELDSSFSRRVIAKLNLEAPSVTALDDRYQSILKRQKHLVGVGLLDQNSIDEPDLNALTDAAVRNVLGTYFEDVEEKLNELQSTAEQMSLFRDIANERLRDKHIQVSGDFGFKVMDNTHGEEVPLSALSSGEQHQLFLLNNLIFPPEPGTMFLIDEPEISMHVAWQRALVDDLDRIAELGASQLILATHSPSLIGDRLELLVDVREGW